MAISHSVWELNWRGLITLFGYISIAKGVARIAFPEVPKRTIKSLLHGPLLWAWLALTALLGGYLTWVGFTYE